MNPIVIAGGIIALLFWNNKSKKQTQVSESDGPIPSPANPSGLDRPSGASTTSEPIPSPANPAGLDVPSEPVSSPANPDALEKDVEPAGEYEVVSDGNWTPSPANPKGLEEELMLDTSTPVSSPANPKGLVDIIISNEDSKSGSSSSDPIASPANPKGLDTPTGPTTNSDPQTGLSLEGANTSGKIVFGAGGGGNLLIGFDKNYPILNKKDSVAFEKLAKSYGVGEPVIVDGARLGFITYGSFVNWLLVQTGFTSAQAGKSKLASGAYTYRAYLLAKQKGLLNEATIQKYIQWREKKIADYKLSKQKSAERAAKPKPKVFAGKVLDENGNYVSPTSQDDCPSGYKYISQRGWTGCVSEERYAEVMSEMAKDYPLLPPKQWSQAILLTYAGNLTDKAALTMPTDKLIEMIRQRAVGCTNKWCKVINDSFITDSTSFVLDRFEYRGVVFGKMDENWIAFYPIPVKVAGRKRKKDLPYIMFALSEQEFKTYKDLAKYYKATK